MMYFKISYYVVLTCYIKMVYSQVTLLEEDPEKPPPYYCTRNLKLKCQYSGTSTCCNTSTRTWRQNNQMIMSNGISLLPEKYKETIDNQEQYFELTIMNIHYPDFDKSYMCEYGFFQSELEFNSDHLECPICADCGARCAAWGSLGDLVTYLLLLFFKCVCCSTIGIPERIILICGAISAATTFHLCYILGLPIGFYCCLCYDFSDTAYDDDDFKDPYFAALLAVVLFGVAFSWMYQKCTCKGCRVKEYQLWNILGWLTIGYVKLYYILFKDVNAVKGSDVELKCPYKETDNQKIIWHRITDNAELIYVENGNVIKIQDKNLQSRLKVINDLGECHLCISKVMKSDEGTYQCSLPGQCFAAYRIQLTVEECDTSTCKKGLFYTGILLLSILILPVPCMVLYYCCFKGGKSQSVESGSSCWPICRVGQDPNSSSSDPEKVRRSPEKERADKKKDRKPTEVVRPQPTRPLPPMHLKTDNTGRAEYSTETEIFKQPALPSISTTSDSPRPLPQKPPGTQLDPLRESTSERKKKKKRKKKEPKQSDEEN